MACYVMYDENRNAIGHLCGDFGAHCKDCGDCGDEFLCDYPVGDGKTCDANLCAFHAQEIAPNLHYCPAHKKLFDDFVLAGGVKKALDNVVPYKKLINQ